MMMNGREKSDSAVVAMKPANKAGEPVAERAEPGAGTEGNTGQPHTHRAQNCNLYGKLQDSGI
uniref:Uncharacterized protein n=1 Tax=Paraburkholderia sprentiae WSM5005 TaxID=754502 RepID=A0A1I9YEP9_9BURK